MTVLQIRRLVAWRISQYMFISLLQERRSRKKIYLKKLCFPAAQSFLLNKGICTQWYMIGKKISSKKQQ